MTRGFATLADIEAFEATPLSQRLSVRDSYAVLRRAAKAHGQRPAIVALSAGGLGGGGLDGKERTWTYANLLDRVTRAANLFHALGVTPDAAVSYLLPNLPETHAVAWGAQAAGIVNPINPLLEPAQVADILRAANTRVLVIPARGEVRGRALEARRLSGGPEAILNVGGAADDGIGESFEAALAAQPGDRLVSGRAIAGDDVCAWFHTGGTTGAPKLAAHTHGNEVFDAWAAGVCAGFEADDVLLVGLPMFHVNAVTLTGLGAFLAGATVVLLSPEGFRDRAMMADIWRIADRYRGTVLTAVPTVFATLLETPVDGADISALRVGICGGSPMPVELFRRFEERIGVRLLEAYGLSEAVAISSMNPLRGERRIGSVGLRLPYQDMKAAILDDEGAYVRDTADGEIGVICVRGPNVGPGYRQPEANRGLFPEPGWLATGDLGRRDGDGYFWLTGRAKDVIIRSGHNIDPALIEDVLHAHPAVALAAAVGRPDPYAGEVPMAYVALRPGAEADGEDLRLWARERVAERPAAPAEVVVIDEIPVTAVGKIFKPALRRDAVRRVVERALPPDLAAAVEVAADPTHGTLVLVHADCAAEPAVAEALRPFAFAWRFAADAGA